VEQAIAELWQQLLGVEQVGIHDNFFTDLGGHSLLATQVISRLRNIFQVELSQQHFFETSTVAELALAIEVMEQEGVGLKGPGIVPVAREQRRATLSASGELQVSEELRKEFSR
jgi:acyl carrier protein